MAAWVVAQNLAARDVTRVIVAKTLHDISRRFRYALRGANGSDARSDLGGGAIQAGFERIV